MQKVVFFFLDGFELLNMFIHRNTPATSTQKEGPGRSAYVPESTIAPNAIA